MQASESGSWLSELTLPLQTIFGTDLALTREENAVRWSYGDDSAFVELHSSGAAVAKFISHAMVDAASGAPLCAVYAAPNRTYPLTRPGIARMVDDMTEFFSGTREPRFTFVDAYVEGFPT